NHADCFLNGSYIFGETVIPKFRAGIAPANCEELNPMGDCILSQTPLRGQIHDVVFINLRRHQQQRTLIDLTSRRRVLNQFAKLVSIYDRTRSRTDILANLEWTLVDLRRHSSIVQQIFGEIPQPFQQTQPTRVESVLESGRIAEQEISGSERFS